MTIYNFRVGDLVQKKSNSHVYLVLSAKQQSDSSLVTYTVRCMTDGKLDHIRSALPKGLYKKVA
jgi:hypothetical protein